MKIPGSSKMDPGPAFNHTDGRVPGARVPCQSTSVNGTALKVFESYLTNRQQYVEYNDICSDLLSITTGVPQGSILGPLLFLIYVNDIACACTSFELVMYADDSTLNIEFLQNYNR